MFEVGKFSDQIWSFKNGIHYIAEDFELSYPEKGNDLYARIEEYSYWFRHRNRVIIDKVKKYSNGQVLFDIGGGNGFVAAGLVSAGVESVLVEPGKEGVSNAKSRGVSNVLCASLESAGFYKNSIPAVGLFDVIEHIEDHIGFLTNIKDLVRPDGMVYITVPAYEFLWSAEDDFAGHFRRYRMNTLLELAKKLGFEVTYRTYLFSFLPLPIFLVRSIPSRLGLRKADEEGIGATKEHNASKGLSSLFVENILNWEFNRIREGKSIPFGSSCFIVLKKT